MTFVEESDMQLPAFNLQPSVAKSEPTTPIHATGSVPTEAPDSSFTPLTHKEKLAIQTMEQVPSILNEAARKEGADYPTNLFSPTLLPFLERMKFHFGRTMALARYEAENGQWDMKAAEEGKGKKKASGPVLPQDVMSSLEVEAFMAAIEEVRHPYKDNEVLFRRYWRILEVPGETVYNTGGVLSTRTVSDEANKPALKQDLQAHLDEAPKALLAEYRVGKNGEAYTGRYIGPETAEEFEEEKIEKKPARKWRKRGRKSFRK